MQLDLIVSSPPSFDWSGQASGSWDTTGSLNWSHDGALASYDDGENVSFGDTDPLTNMTVPNTGGVATITIQQGGVQPASAVFDNAAVNYVLVDAAGDTVGIAGAAGIIQLGTGRVTLADANSFTGPVQISAGSVNLQNPSALGNSIGVTVGGGAALELQGAMTFGAAPLGGTIPLNLTGGGLAANPSGALNSVSGDNVYVGPITVGSGGATIDSSNPGDTLTLTGGIDTGGNPLSIGGAGNVAIDTNPIAGSGA